MSSLAPPRSGRRPAADLTSILRFLVAGGALIGLGLILSALLRALAGAAPHGAALREAALVVHLVAVVPALPLGAYVLLSRKGTPRHRLLGKLWLLLMIVGALSAVGIRHLNDGRFSAIHLLIPVVLVGGWRLIASARRGDIVAHKRVLVGLFVGGLIVPALLSFLPGRLMALWLVG